MSASPQDLHRLLADAVSIHGLAADLVLDPCDADDLAQEVIVRRMGSDDSAVEHRRAWLAGMVRNVAVTLGLRRQAQVQRESAVAREELVPSTANILEREETRRVVLEAVLAMAEPYRSVLVLRYLEELPLREVAHRLGVPVETVRTRTRRGLESLRQGLDQRFGERGAWSLLLLPYLSPSPALPKAATLLTTMMSAKKVLLVAGAVLTIIATLSYKSWLPEASNLPDAAPLGPADLPSAQAANSTAFEAKESNTVVLASERKATGEERSEAKTAAIQLCSVKFLLTFARTEQPAVDVPVLILAQDNNSGLASRRSHTRRTDQLGEVLLEDIPPGRFSFLLNTMYYDSVRLEPGSDRTFRIEIPRGFGVAGVVRDGNGQGIEGAEIVVDTFSLRVGQELVVALTDSTGAYQLRDMDPEASGYLTARKVGFHSTSRRAISALVGAEITVDFNLERGGAALTGLVLDSGRSPIHGAEVWVGNTNPDLQVKSKDGASTDAAVASYRLTDEDGRFDVSWTDDGDVSISIRARGFAPYTETLSITPGSSSQHKFQLLRGSRLEGVALAPNGEPVEKIEINAGGWNLLGKWAATDERGRYAIEDVPVGKYKLRIAPKGFLPINVEVFGVSGQTTIFDLPLSRGLSVSGIVTCEGNPCPNLRFEAVGFQPGVGYGHSAGKNVRTDEQGRFEIQGLIEGLPYSVAVFRPRSSEALLRKNDVMPGTRDLVIELDPSDLAQPSVYLRGRVRDSNGDAVPEVIFGIYGPMASYSNRLVAEDGTFGAGPCREGEFSLFLRAPGFATQRISTPTLNAGETHDFGDLVMTAGGRVQIEFTRGPDAPEAAPKLLMYHLDGHVQTSFVLDGDSALSLPAIPGRHRVSAFGYEGTPFAGVGFTVEIKEGETTHVEYMLERGYARQLHITLSDQLREERTHDLQIFDTSGELISTTRIGGFIKPEGFTWRTRMQAGTYRFVIAPGSVYKAEIFVEYSEELDGDVQPFPFTRR